MYEVGKCPKHSGSESLSLLRHCILWSRSRLAKISLFLKIGYGYVIAALLSPIWRWQYMRFEGQTMYHVTLIGSSYEGTMGSYCKFSNYINRKRHWALLLYKQQCVKALYLVTVIIQFVLNMCPVYLSKLDRVLTFKTRNNSLSRKMA